MMPNQFYRYLSPFKILIIALAFYPVNGLANESKSFSLPCSARNASEQKANILIDQAKQGGRTAGSLQNERPQAKNITTSSKVHEIPIYYDSYFSPYVKLDLQNGDRKISVNVTFDTGSYYTYFQKNIISDLGLQKSNQVIEITGLGSTLKHSVFSGNLSSNENQFPSFVLQSSPALEKHLRKSSLSGMLGLEVLKAWGVIIDFSTNKFIIPRLAKEAKETHNNSLQNLSNMKAEELIHADPSSSLNTHSIKSEGTSLRNADDSRLLVRNTTEELEIADRVYNINYSPSSYDPYIQIQTRGETEKIQLSLLIDTGACFGNLTEAIIQRLALKQIPIRRETSLLHESGRAEQYYKAFLGISQNPSYFGDLGAKNSQHFKEIGLDGLIGVHILKGQMGAILNFQNDTLTVMSDKPMPAVLDEEMQPSCQQRYIWGTRYTVCCDINRCWVQD